MCVNQREPSRLPGEGNRNVRIGAEWGMAEWTIHFGKKCGRVARKQSRNWSSFGNNRRQEIKIRVQGKDGHIRVAKIQVGKISLPDLFQSSVYSNYNETLCGNTDRAEQGKTLYQRKTFVRWNLMIAVTIIDFVDIRHSETFPSFFFFSYRQKLYAVTSRGENGTKD